MADAPVPLEGGYMYQHFGAVGIVVGSKRLG